MTENILKSITIGTNICDITEKSINENHTVKGFVEKVRDQKFVQFLNINDGTGTIQVVCEKKDAHSKLNDEISDLKTWINNQLKW